jgi:hypothetical protein
LWQVLRFIVKTGLLNVQGGDELSKILHSICSFDNFVKYKTLSEFIIFHALKYFKPFKNKTKNFSYINSAFFSSISPHTLLRSLAFSSLEDMI